MARIPPVFDEQTAAALTGGNAHTVGISNGVICRDRYILRQSESGSIKNRMEIRHDLQFSIFIQSQLHGYATHFI